MKKVLMPDKYMLEKYANDMNRRDRNRIIWTVILLIPFSGFPYSVILVLYCLIVALKS